MISHGKNRVGGDAEIPKDSKSKRFVDFGSKSQRDRRTTGESFGELMTFLSDSYENRRARQTSEWESMRRQSLRKAS